MSASVEIARYRPGYRDALVDLWRASFAWSGAPVPNPVDETFVIKANAQRFYARHGFEVVERGCEPVMQLGDLRHEWKSKA